MRAVTAGLATMLLAGLPAGAAYADVPQSLQKIGHILVIFEENRSFDHLFGHFPGANGLGNADGAAIQVGQDGKPLASLPDVKQTWPPPPTPDGRFPKGLENRPFDIGPFVKPSELQPDMVHRFYQEQAQINGGKMDKFAAISDAGGVVMGYYDPKDSHLWHYASEYALGDAMFHSAFGGSMLNHTFLVCGCAFRWPNAPAKFVAVKDANGGMVKDGAVSPDGYVINTAHSVQLHPPSETDPAGLVPPQTMPHIGDRLDAKGVSWVWYAGGYADAMAGHPGPLFQWHHAPLTFFADLAPGTPAQKAHLKDYTDLEADIAAGTLPQVAFYKPYGSFNQHPGYANLTDGDAHLFALVEKLKASPQWKDMLILVTYDENGGEWDHVAPPIRDPWGPGTRIPLVAIGPTVKPHFIDHTTYDFGSILRTIELTFGAEPVNERDGTANPMTNLLE
jgi:phospholipase C